MSNCNCHTEINTDGSGRLSRYLKALDPSYVHIDDRSIADLLVFAKRYAAQIRFYDMPGTGGDEEETAPKISWREFFRRDMAVVIASIGVIDATQIRRNYDEIRAGVELQPDETDFSELFSPVLGMVARIDKWYSLAIPENPLHTDLEMGITSSLKLQIAKLRAYAKGFASVSPQDPLQIDYSAIKNRQLWGLDEYVKADTNIYEGNSYADKIRNAALYIDDVFNSFYGFITHLINISDSYLQYALEQYPAHQPHMALFIAFLRLFKAAQDQMNGLTERMLNFYYRDVLQLTEKPSVADRAYIVFELAKDVLAYNVAEGTVLKGGKDASGKEQLYATGNDLVVNEAKVKELKTLFIDKSADKTKIEALYARPVANSADGYGEKFIDPSGKWPTFGKGHPERKDLKNICQEIEQRIELESRKDLTELGFAIASPQLLLQAGNRLIKLHVKDLGKVISGNAISLRMTGEEGWLQIDKKEDRIVKLIEESIFTNTRDLERCYSFVEEEDAIYIFLPVAEKGIISFDAELHKGFAVVSPHPVMQIMIRHGLGIDADAFSSVRCDKLEIEVWVGSINQFSAVERDDVFLNQKPNMDGLTTLIIKNDDGLVSPGKPFDPFTGYPQQGNSFSIASDELFNKPIDQLTVNIELVSPANSEKDLLIRFMKSKEILNELFAVSVLAKGQRTELFRKEIGDLSFTLGELTQNILVSNKDVLDKRQPILYDQEIVANSYKGLITIKNLLPLQFVKRDGGSFELLQELARLLKIRQLSVSYHSRLKSMDPGTDQFFHVYPFGVAETYFDNQPDEAAPAAIDELDIVRVAGRASSLYAKSTWLQLDKEKEYLIVDGKDKLLPQFSYQGPYSAFLAGTIKIKDYQRLLRGRRIKWNDEIVPRMIEASGLRTREQGSNNQYSDTLQEEGMLFIGMEKLKPLQSVSLLFQFAEGSAADEDNDPPPIHWSYLSFNEWKPLKEEQLVSDGTAGFQATGIIKIDIPEDASDHNTIITDGLIWLCASVEEHSDRIPMLIDVRAQAVEVKFTDQDNDPAHFDKPLKAESIGKLLTPVAEIGKVVQPFASFDGKRRETGREFYTRVSERLRHKGRAITAWDYEHLILERFPVIYKVKCITHTDPNCLCRHPLETADAGEICCGPQIAPGHVLIIPVADLKNRNAVNPLQPKTSRRTLIDIKNYISARTSPFVKVHVRNPIYEQILVSFKVKFYPGKDKGFFLKQLNEDIVHFLSPWAFDADAELKFGQKVYASAIINFIEERPYVDFITDFLLFVCKDECCPPTAEPIEISDNSSRNILASLSLTVVKDGDTVRKLTGTITDTASGEGIAGVTIGVKGTSNGDMTQADGSFEINIDKASFPLMVSLISYEKVEIDAKVTGVTEFQFTSIPSELPEVVVTGYGSSGIRPAELRGCGCAEIEEVLGGSAHFKGETVVKPSTARSILVSVPQHTIIPYEEPVKPSPCEERKKKRLAIPVVNAVDMKKPAAKKKAVRKQEKKKPGKAGKNNG